MNASMKIARVLGLVVLLLAPAACTTTTTTVSGQAGVRYESANVHRISPSRR